MHSSLVKRSWIAAGFFALLQCSHLAKMSYIVGSYASFFSASSITTPLVGAYCSTSSVVGTFIFSVFVRSALIGFNPFFLCVHQLPGLCAALYWRTGHWMLNIVLPLTCIVLFSMHPVGGSAWLYTLYWFIPVLLSFLQTSSLYATALSSTFIAHAVGSVLWLYGTSMPASLWLNLIPLVGCERLVFATSMIGVQYIIDKLVTYTVQKSSYA